MFNTIDQSENIVNSIGTASLDKKQSGHSGSQQFNTLIQEPTSENLKPVNKAASANRVFRSKQKTNPNFDQDPYDAGSKKVKRDFENIDVSSAYQSAVQQSDKAHHSSDHQSVGAVIDKQLNIENHKTEPSLQHTGRGQENSSIQQIHQQQLNTDDENASPRPSNWDNILVQAAQFPGTTLPLVANSEGRNKLKKELTRGNSDDIAIIGVLGQKEAQNIAETPQKNQRLKSPNETDSKAE